MNSFYGPDKTQAISKWVSVPACSISGCKFTVDGFHVEVDRGASTQSDRQRCDRGYRSTVRMRYRRGSISRASLRSHPESRFDRHLFLCRCASDAGRDRPRGQSGGSDIDAQSKGDRLPGSAKNSGSARLIYTYPLSNDRTRFRPSWADNLSRRHLFARWTARERRKNPRICDAQRTSLNYSTEPITTSACSPTMYSTNTRSRRSATTSRPSIRCAPTSSNAIIRVAS